MNYEERKQILNKDDIESEKDVNNQEEDNKTNIHLKWLSHIWLNRFVSISKI